jgi:hypothetical protein
MDRRIIFLLLITTLLTYELRCQDLINLAESTSKISGLTEEEFYFGFAEGDQIVFNFKELKGKELKEVEIIELPSSSKFLDYKTKKIENKTINVTRTGIYKFRFNNSAIGGRVCNYKIERIPESGETRDFNSNVYWKTLYDTTFTTVQEEYLERDEFVTKTIVPVTNHYINSGSNATFKGGTSRITIPVTLPPNTQEWYYEFTASRNKDEVDKVTSTFKLAGELSMLIDQTGALGFGIDLLTQPPGGDVSNIYLMDFDNSRLFEAKQGFQHFPIGSRENIKSGVVKLTQGNNETVYLGIMNPDNMNGIHVAIEVVAITHEQELGTRNVEKMRVSKRKEPYLKQ